jgi:hypothetical protein
MAVQAATGMAAAVATDVEEATVAVVVAVEAAAIKEIESKFCCSSTQMKHLSKAEFLASFGQSVQKVSLDSKPPCDFWDY